MWRVPHPFILPKNDLCGLYTIYKLTGLLCTNMQYCNYTTMGCIISTEVERTTQRKEQEKMSINEMMIDLKAAEIHHSQAMNETLDEDTQDKEYMYFWEACKRIAENLVKLTNGAIDKQTALKMAVHKRNEIERIICKA